MPRIRLATALRCRWSRCAVLMMELLVEVGRERPDRRVGPGPAQLLQRRELITHRGPGGVGGVPLHQHPLRADHVVRGDPRRPAGRPRGEERRPGLGGRRPEPCRPLRPGGRLPPTVVSASSGSQDLAVALQAHKSSLISIDPGGLTPARRGPRVKDASRRRFHDSMTLPCASGARWAYRCVVA